MKVVKFITDGKLNLDYVLDQDGFELEILVGYIGVPGTTLRIKENIKIVAKNTKVSVKNYGVLFSDADKELSMLLDYENGASGATGLESDDVLVLGEGGLKNKVTPAISCAEMDVEATHAVSVAEMDEKEVSYLINRGFSGRQARQMIIRSKLSPVLDELDGRDKEVAVIKLREVLEEYL